MHAKIGVADFLLGTALKPEATPPLFGILPLVWGTFVVAFGSSCIALPIGLMSAIYLSEYAPRRLRAVLKPSLELLAGMPTIVYGYLALLLVTPVLKAVFEPMGLRVEQFNALSACIVVGVMIMPMVSSLSEDVLSAVPRGLREAAYGLGATKFEVSTRVVLPAGLSGVVASFMLAISRAVGETMAVVLAAGMLPQITLNPLTSIETMTTYIVAGDRRRGVVRVGQVPVAVRGGHGPLRDHADPEHHLEPRAPALSRGLPMSRAVDARPFHPPPPRPPLAGADLRDGLLPGDADRRGRADRAAGGDRRSRRSRPAAPSVVRGRGEPRRSFSALLAADHATGSRATRRSRGSASG